jgi:hypothetical protein
MLSSGSVSSTHRQLIASVITLKWDFLIADKLMGVGLIGWVKTPKQF